MSCADICVGYDGDAGQADFYSESRPRAAKPHRCVECNAEIARGEIHHRVSGKWEGDFATFRTCLECDEIRRAFCCGGWEIGGLWDAIRDELFPRWNEMVAVDCLAKLTTDAAIAKMRARYGQFVEDQS